MSKKRFQVLLVGDEKTQMRWIKRSIEKQTDHLKLTTVPSLEEANNYLKTSTPDIVFTNSLPLDGKGTTLLQERGGEGMYPIVLMGDQGDTRQLTRLIERAGVTFEKERALLEARIETGVEKLKKADRQLKNEIKKREKIERELRKLKEEAGEESRAKSEFLANMSHDLRTPLHAILSYSRFGINKIEKVDQAKILTYFKRIETAGKTLQSMLTNLVDLSRMESGRMRYQKYKSNILLIVDSVIDTFQGEIDAKRLTVRVESTREQHSVVCDQNRIEQVLENLLSNAIKFSEDGKQILIAVKESELNIDGNTLPGVRLDVIDEGTGIPGINTKTTLEQLIRNPTAGIGGKGLGLPICNEIIKSHEGTIWCENTPSGGAAFSFTLPAKPTD